MNGAVVLGEHVVVHSVDDDEYYFYQGSDGCQFRELYELASTASGLQLNDLSPKQDKFVGELLEQEIILSESGVLKLPVLYEEQDPIPEPLDCYPSRPPGSVREFLLVLVTIFLAKSLLLLVRVETAVSLVRKIGRTRGLVFGPTKASAVTSARLFNQFRHLAPIRRVCILDSLACFILLAFKGVQGVDFVFGVQMYPFSAHCWLETDQCVINEDPYFARAHHQINRFPL